MIKFEHSIFALPFALMASFLAVQGIPPWPKIFWVVVAMVGARSAAMSFNRLVDAPYDSLNPRTQSRALPAGKIRKGEVILFLVLSCSLFFAAALALNKLCFLLSPLFLSILLLYSYTKRFTSLSHVVLGLCLGLSPIGGWVAMSGRLDMTPLVLGLGVLFWVSGFDIIYACLDYDFDRKAGLYSIPQRFGLRGGLRISLGLHILAALCFFLIWFLAGLGAGYGIAFGVTLFFLAYQHLIVQPSNLSRVNISFFVANGIISIVLCSAAMFDIVMMKG
jgi:4-hydroxybenzoate polyprenyltransferase